MKCSNCGAENVDQASFCGYCGTPLRPPTATPTAESGAPYLASELMPGSSFASHTLTIEQRREILDGEIVNWVKRGFQVVARTDTTVQLVKPKKLSCGLLLFSLVLWLVVIGIFLTLLILLVHLAGKPETVYLQVDEAGRIKSTRGSIG